MDPEDARLAVESGADAIVVSNRGGRQLVGGIRSGQDVLKAWALGARGTDIGRAIVYGLGAMGEAVVTTVLQIINTELDTTMAFCAHTRIATVDAGILAPAPPDLSSTAARTTAPLRAVANG